MKMKVLMVRMMKIAEAVIVQTYYEMLGDDI